MDTQRMDTAGICKGFLFLTRKNGFFFGTVPPNGWYLSPLVKIFAS